MNSASHSNIWFCSRSRRLPSSINSMTHANPPCCMGTAPMKVVMHGCLTTLSSFISIIACRDKGCLPLFCDENMEWMIVVSPFPTILMAIGVPLCWPLITMLLEPRPKYTSGTGNVISDTSIIRLSWAAARHLIRTKTTKIRKISNGMIMEGRPTL